MDETAAPSDTLNRFKAWLVWKRLHAEAGRDADTLEAIEHVDKLLHQYEQELVHGVQGSMLGFGKTP